MQLGPRLATAKHLEQNGFALLPSILPPSALSSLDLPELTERGRGGSRCLLDQPWCADLARQLLQHPALRDLIPDDHVAVQCTYFEKSATRNWLVAVHQDLSIPVATQLEHPELRGWSHKDGSHFVQAPREVLEQLLAVRVHLDDCGPDDGPLRVVPATHTQGIIDAHRAVELRDASGETECAMERGDALAMRPLLLHASSKGRGNSRRRVLHFVFGPPALPFGLRWQVAVR